MLLASTARSKPLQLRDKLLWWGWWRPSSASVEKSVAGHRTRILDVGVGMRAGLLKLQLGKSLAKLSSTLRALMFTLRSSSLRATQPECGRLCPLAGKRARDFVPFASLITRAGVLHGIGTLRTGLMQVGSAQRWHRRDLMGLATTLET